VIDLGGDQLRIFTIDRYGVFSLFIKISSLKQMLGDEFGEFFFP